MILITQSAQRNQKKPPELNAIWTNLTKQKEPSISHLITDHKKNGTKSCLVLRLQRVIYESYLGGYLPYN